MRSRIERSIALVGIMGAGKSTVGRLLALGLGVAFVDLDAAIEAVAGRSVAELFAREGEPAFRRRESRALAAALGREASVVACGGGVVLDPAHRRLLRERCHCVWLEVSAAVAWRRLAREASGRPLLAMEDGERRLGELIDERSALYREVAETRIATDGRTPEEVARALLEALAAAGPRA